MRGSIALVGSGEYLPAMAEFERSLIADGIKNGKDPLFLQIPTAAGREGRERLSYWQKLGRSQADALGVEQVFLPIYERADAVEFDQDELLDRSALIYISGGDPHHLANALRDLYRDALALFQPGKEPTHRMLRPAGGFRDLRHRRALRAAEHGKHHFLLGALARLAWRARGACAAP